MATATAYPRPSLTCPGMMKVDRSKLLRMSERESLLTGENHLATSPGTPWYAHCSLMMENVHFNHKLVLIEPEVRGQRSGVSKKIEKKEDNNVNKTLNIMRTYLASFRLVDCT